MLEISEEVVRGVATICGPHSAAANALKDAETRRGRGEAVTFYKERGRLIVHGVLVTAYVDAKPLTRCAANRDCECGHAQCPQLRDNEPCATGRHCPLDIRKEDD